MLLERERKELVEVARRLERDDLALGTSGNLSVRADDLVVITPSGVDYDVLTPELVCVVQRDGTPVETEAKVSTELPMHLAVYDATDAMAVVHTHPPYATVLSTVVDELPPIHYLIAFEGGPVRVAPYATPGSEELAKIVIAALENRSAVLLQNHGALTIGPSLESAYFRSWLLEWLCSMYYRARLAGDPRVLSDDELSAVDELLRDYGPARE